MKLRLHLAGKAAELSPQSSELSLLQPFCEELPLSGILPIYVCNDSYKCVLRPRPFTGTNSTFAHIWSDNSGVYFSPFRSLFIVVFFCHGQQKQSFRTQQWSVLWSICVFSSRQTPKTGVQSQVSRPFKTTLPPEGAASTELRHIAGVLL